MPGATPLLGLRYSLQSEIPDAEQGLEDLADDIESWLQPLFACKETDESVTNSTNLQSDNHLSVTMAANRTYRFELLLIVSSTSTTPDLKYGLTLPANTSVSLGNAGMRPDDTDGTNALVFMQAASSLQTTTLLSSFATGTYNGSVTVFMSGIVVTGGTAGNFTLHWSQNTSDAAATTLKAGSYVYLTRVA